MSGVDQPKPFNTTNVTASVSGVLIGVAALIPEDVLPTSAKGIIAMLAGIISPYLASLLVRWHRKLDIDPALMDLKNRLQADLDTQNTLLASGNLTASTVEAIQAKREVTMVRMASLNQDFNDGTIAVKSGE
ncbi:hypothetical protein [Pseudomonas bohemica]|uniref:hypothetical protein n=1 Tax=Pseudomonas bohemica TaxID=2044872 RepID=UPI000DA5F89E|nr:hypothetical protein [Pseudomonas bohemica]